MENRTMSLKNSILMVQKRKIQTSNHPLRNNMQHYMYIFKCFLIKMSFAVTKRTYNNKQ